MATKRAVKKRRDAGTKRILTEMEDRVEAVEKAVYDAEDALSEARFTLTLLRDMARDSDNRTASLKPVAKRRKAVRK